MLVLTSYDDADQPKGNRLKADALARLAGTDHVTSIIFHPFSPLKISEVVCSNGAEWVSRCVNRGFFLLVTDGCWHQLWQFLCIHRSCVQGSCAFLHHFESSDRSSEPQEGLADCIANEDGERQIASAISFHGEETVRTLPFQQILRFHT